MSADATSIPRAPLDRLLAIALLLPLPIVLLAAWRYDFLANIRGDYRWLVASVVMLFGALAACARLAAARGWKHALLPPVLAACVPLAGVVVFAGWMHVVVSLLLALAALAVASCLRSAREGGIGIALMVGLACLAALVGWLLPFPIHHRAAYLAMASLLVVARWRALQAMVRAGWSGMRDAMSAHPAWSILLAGAATIASLGLWLPSLNYDDNAVHLILPSQLLADGYYRLDVQTQSWAVAPWANNVLHAITGMFAGEEARSAARSNHIRECRS